MHTCEHSNMQICTHTHILHTETARDKDRDRRESERIKKQITHTQDQYFQIWRGGFHVTKHELLQRPKPRDNAFRREISD